MFAHIARITVIAAATTLAACGGNDDVARAGLTVTEGEATGLIVATTWQWAPQVTAVKFELEAVPCNEEFIEAWKGEAVLHLRPDQRAENGTPRAEVFFEVSPGCYGVKTKLLGENDKPAELCHGDDVQVEHDGAADLEVNLFGTCQR